MTLEYATTMFLVMLVAQIPLLVAAVVNYLKIKYSVEKAQVVEDKLDDNTRITKDGTREATANARAAAKTAVEVKAATETIGNNINRKLNGGIDSAVTEAIKPVKDALDAHIIQDAQDLRNILEAINAQSLKIQLLINTAEAKGNTGRG